MYILTTYQRITQNGLSNKKYESDKVSSTKWNYFKLQLPLLIFVIYTSTLNLTRLYSKLTLIVFVIILLNNLVVLFDKPKLYENGVYIDTQRIDWREISSYHWKKNKSSEYYSLIIKLKINRSKNNRFFKKKKFYELFFHEEKADDIEKFLKDKTHHLT